MMRGMVVVLLLMFAGGIGWTSWTAHVRAGEAEAAAARWMAARDSAVAQAERAQAEADSMAQEMARLDSLRLAERARARVRRMRTEARADSLEAEVEALMPPELVDIEIREAVMDAVSDLRREYEAEIAGLDNLLVLTERTLERSRAQVERSDRVNASLRRALTAETERADLWEHAAKPGILLRLKQDAGLLGAAAAVGGVVVLALTAG